MPASRTYSGRLSHPKLVSQRTAPGTSTRERIGDGSMTADWRFNGVALTWC